MPGLRILVVDRAQDTRVALARLLEAEGYSVYAVADAGDAHCVARLAPFDLLITDLGRPDRPEVSLLRDLAGPGGPCDPGLAGIAVTAMQPDDYGGENVIRRAGYAAALLKPIRFEELRALIGRVAAVGGG